MFKFKTFAWLVRQHKWSFFKFVLLQSNITDWDVSKHTSN